MAKIEKETKRIIAFTSNFKVEGDIHVHIGARLSDYIETLTKSFIPLTRVIIYKIGEDKPIHHTNFLELNKDEVVIISPKEEI